MEMLQYFLECYFHFNESFDNLDQLIQDFKSVESDKYQTIFIKELFQIIQTKNYETALHHLSKYGRLTFNLEEAKTFINFLYDRLTDRPTNIKSKDFQKNCQFIFCPVCTPDIEKATRYSLIDKATIIKNNMQIYICKPCKLIWLTQPICANNSQSYKNFMKILGLKGLWKELYNIYRLDLMHK